MLSKLIKKLGVEKINPYIAAEDEKYIANLHKEQTKKRKRAESLNEDENDEIDEWFDTLNKDYQRNLINQQDENYNIMERGNVLINNKTFDDINREKKEIKV